jgi:hypothetical protein
MLTLRVRAHGTEVVEGDLVAVPYNGSTPPKGLLTVIDEFKTKDDHTFDVGEELNYVDTTSPLSLHSSGLSQEDLSRIARVMPSVPVTDVFRVETAEEAKRYSIFDVVLPVWGRGIESDFLFPTNVVNVVTIAEMAKNLAISSVKEMNLSPNIGYRRVMCRFDNFSSSVVDDVRSISLGDWSHTFVDSEGARRNISPLMNDTSGRRLVARPGIPEPVRGQFLEPIRAKGWTCCIRGRVPRGAALSSILREAFQSATVDTGAIVRALKRR